MHEPGFGHPEPISKFSGVGEAPAYVYGSVLDAHEVLQGKIKNGYHAMLQYAKAPLEKATDSGPTWGCVKWDELVTQGIQYPTIVQDSVFYGPDYNAGKTELSMLLEVFIFIVQTIC